MKNELITKLNELISDINPTTIQSHIDDGTLDNWIYDWRTEIGAVSFGLFTIITLNNRE